MKHIIVLCDGMSDWPDESGQTPMSLAHKPDIDRLASCAEVGLCQTIPAGMSPGSDTANLSVIGCDPAVYYTGRSPLEALSMGVQLHAGDIAYRVNLVTLSDEPVYADKTMLDYSAGEICTAEAASLIGLLQPSVPSGYELYSGVSYRHLLVKRTQNGTQNVKFTPPHDITGKKITTYLPNGAGAELFTAFMEQSAAILEKNGSKANSAWVWGAGTKPDLPSFKEKFGINGAMISAVNLLKGIGVGTGLESIDVPGATGTVHTDFDGKARAAIDALSRCDFVFVHLEAPDECGHQGDRAGKVRSIELISKKIVAPIVAAMGNAPFKILILPDHATPLKIRTHTSEPVPYLLYDSTNEKSGVPVFTESAAKATGIVAPEGHKLIEKLIGSST